jgi:hypothetical protein
MSAITGYLLGVNEMKDFFLLSCKDWLGDGSEFPSSAVTPLPTKVQVNQ